MSYREELEVQKPNIVAALYPSTKFLLVICMVICIAVAANTPVFGYDLLLVAIFLLVPILFGVSGIGDRLLGLFKPIFVLSGVILIMQSILLKGGNTLLVLGPVTIAEAGLQHAIFLAFIILDISGAILWFFQTTDVNEISYALEKSGVSRQASFVFVSTFQMIDLLSASSKQIMNAQQARGVETQGNLLVRAKAFFPMVVPLVVSSILGAEERTLTLQSRGFDVPCAKTQFVEVRKSGKESLATAIALVITMAFVAGRVLAWIL